MAHALHFAPGHALRKTAAQGLVLPRRRAAVGEIDTVYVGARREGFADHLAPFRYEKAALVAGRLVRKRPHQPHTCFREHNQPSMVNTILMNCTTP